MAADNSAINTRHRESKICADKNSLYVTSDVENYKKKKN